MARAMMNSAGARATHRQRRCPPDWRRASAQPSNPPTRTPGKRTRRKVPVQVKPDSVPASYVIQPRRLADHARPPNAISRRLLPVTLDDCNRGDSTSIGDIPGTLTVH